MKLILVEFSWHAKEIVNNKEYFKSDVIVSLDPESSYILKINGVKYFETYQFCNHTELWSKYKEITNRSIKITKVLDETLWKIDRRFRELNWKLFNDYHAPLKLSFDQLFYYSELISKLIKKFNPSEITVADAKKILIDDNLFYINYETSVIKYLLKTLEEHYPKVKISFVSSNQSGNSMFLFFGYFKKSIFIFINNFIKKRIKNIYYKLNFLINYYLSKPKYLAIGCNEILQYKKLYPKQSKFFLSYNHNFILPKQNNNSKFLNLNRKKFIKKLTLFNKFMECLKNETNFYELIKHKNISFKLIFHEILFKLMQQLDFLLDEHNKAKKIINRTKPECVIFQNMNPFYSANITFRKNCIDLKIPFVTWMHGGYGLTYSMCGYDIIDFRLCKNHISYGVYLKDLVADDKCVLKQLKLDENQKIFPVGSPRLDYDNRKRNLKKNLKTNNKQTIVFFMGMPRSRNQNIFGRNREKHETSLWELHYDILYLLQKYQNKYNIIFKDYPNDTVGGRKSLWKSILKDIGADKISYISNEYTANDLLRISDLNILPWISTTFFEALYFDADIFIIEEDIFEKAFDQKLKDEIFYFENAGEFKFDLKKYLEEGHFYKCKKNLSKKYLLNFDYLNNRDKLLNEVLDNISKN